MSDWLTPIAFVVQSIALLVQAVLLFAFIRTWNEILRRRTSSKEIVMLISELSEIVGKKNRKETGGSLGESSNSQAIDASGWAVHK